MIVLVRIGKQGLRWQSEEVTTRKTKKSAERVSHGLEWEPLVREYAKRVPCPKSNPVSQKTCPLPCWSWAHAGYSLSA